MQIPKLNIGGLIAEIPIIQGGMAVGVSGPRLAAAVANAGGVGVIAGVDIGYKEPDFRKNVLEANLRALKEQVALAKRLAPKGIIGINLMVAMNHYQEMARAAAQAGVDLIISGAGLPTKLPGLVKGFETRLVPVVSSGKAAKLILQFWDRHFDRTADAVVVEGPEAGGHLGFSAEVLQSTEKPALLDLVREVKAAIAPFQEKYGHEIPVIAAGGIFSGADISQALHAGAAGVQMATRFVATDECDADIKFKEAYVNAKKEDIVIIKSLVGMPGRALNNPFIQRVAGQRDEIRECFRCLTACDPKTAPYCISKALINAVTGNVDEGLIFVGSNVDKIDKIVPVKQLVDELMAEVALAP